MTVFHFPKGSTYAQRMANPEYAAHIDAIAQAGPNTVADLTDEQRRVLAGLGDLLLTRQATRRD